MIFQYLYIFSTGVCQLTRHSATFSGTNHTNKATSTTFHHATGNITHNASSRQSPTVNSTVNLVEELQHRLSKISVKPLPSGLYLSPQTNVEYRLPAHVGNELTEQIIVDPAVSNAVRECPTIVPDKEMEDPSRGNRIMDMPPVKGGSVKHARVTNIIMIRKKKMIKHKLKKRRKLMQFTTHLILQRRKKKKRKAWEARLETYKFKGLSEEMIENFLVKRQRKLGYLKEYFRAEAGLNKNSEKSKGRKVGQAPAGPITPTPILPPGAVRR